MILPACSRSPVGLVALTGGGSSSSGMGPGGPYSRSYTIYARWTMRSVAGRGGGARVRLGGPDEAVGQGLRRPGEQGHVGADEDVGSARSRVAIGGRWIEGVHADR